MEDTVAVFREKRAGVACHSNCSSSTVRALPCHGVTITDRPPEYHPFTRNHALFFWKAYRQTQGKNWQYPFSFITHHAMIHKRERR